VFPSLVGIVILAPILVQIIPRYNQWTPALIPLVFIAINFMFAAATTQLTNLLNAIGKIKITFYLMIMWTALTWVFVPLLAYKFGVTGASVGYSLVGLSSIIAIVIAKRYVNFSISESMLKPVFGAILMGLVIVILKTFLPVSLYSMLILTGVGILVYLISMVTMIGISLLDDAKRSIKTVFTKN
jgi:O-antigen/teichoic acid export membrane protein